MPHALPADHNAYFRTYNAQRWAKRKAILIAMLGGQCARCDSTNDLQFDHIDPASKLFNVTSRPLTNWQRLQDEAMKCQLLCPDHHMEKTLAERKTRVQARAGSHKAG